MVQKEELPMKNKYIYKTKFVKTPEEYIAAVKRGYCVIRYPQEIKEPLLEALKKEMKDSLDLQYSYIQVKTDNKTNKLGLKRNFKALYDLASKGNLRALNCTAVIYDHYDDDRAYFRYKKAADAGFMLAKANLAIYYENHEEYELYVDNKAHVKLYKEAADAGLASAQYIYGARFAQDQETKLRYLYAAAKQKYVKAYAKLAELVSNIDEQLYWSKKALKEGNTEMYDYIGYIYAVKKDTKKAIYYYTKGMRSNDENSAHVLISIYPNLISEKVYKEAEKVIHRRKSRFQRIIRKIRSEEENNYSYYQEMFDEIDRFDEGKPVHLDDAPLDKEEQKHLDLLREAEEFDAAQKAGFLGMSLDMMEEIIQACYKEDDEEGTLSRIAICLKDLESKQTNKFERFIFRDLKLRFDNLSYLEIAEIYETLN